MAKKAIKEKKRVISSKTKPSIMPADSSSSVTMQQSIHQSMAYGNQSVDGNISNDGSDNFQGEMDLWVKSFNARITKTEQLIPKVEEVTQNTDYNYELIKDQKREIESLKAEIKKLHNLMTVALRSRSLKDISFE